MPPASDGFAKRVIDWYRAHGRHDLPWQHPRSPYRVWLSEIMLQQTQVTTVIPYFERFVDAFPDVVTLANTPLDDVLHRWSGLGYYARARNLHAAAQTIRDRHGGEFPADAEALEALPGIGRSTAAAIVAQAFGQRAAILDGNVKRVLARYFAVPGWPGRSAVANALWSLSERVTPDSDIVDYTQGIMDLGATVCTRSSPGCVVCPLRTDCEAFRLGEPTSFPGKKPKRAKPLRTTVMLLLKLERAVLLQRRPPSGIWGGLWGFPEFDAVDDIPDWCRQALNVDIALDSVWPVMRHSFSHYDLDITPQTAVIERAPDATVMEGDRHLWYNVDSPSEVGLAAPVAVLLERIRIAAE